MGTKDVPFSIVTTGTATGTDGGSNSPKLGKLLMGIEMGSSAGNTGSSVSSSRTRDSRWGADARALILPPAARQAIGVLETGAVTSGTFFSTGGAGCATTFTWVLNDSFVVGGPKLGRRRLSPKPAQIQTKL